ncbi:TetR-like C-terminal domain-containing protein [Nocardia sp. NPDC101769]|uniref:TetR-like C-terminal domain-containing protein n=1 Tax=Nocardia sp. NPDC101769 TaxID=3364333 RepID=UPI0038197002
MITALVRDAYRSLADTLRAVRDSGVTGLAHAIREWALTDPQRYFLIYGTPVPGYHAPADTTEISDEIMTLLVEAFSALPQGNSTTPLDADLPPAARRALSFWTRLHGVLSLELAGHFNGMDFDPAELFAAELDSLIVR